jgi:serine/threonine protein kinase
MPFERCEQNHKNHESDRRNCSCDAISTLPDVIHRDLKPDNILLDWDWEVRIAEFGHSTSLDDPDIQSLTDPDEKTLWPSVDDHYLAPECSDDRYFPESDVFLFRLILSELLVGQPAFSKSLTRDQIAVRVAVKDKRPLIPDSVIPDVQKLITACWASEPEERPSFEEIVERLVDMRFKMMANVNSMKISVFVKRIEKK